MKKIVKEYLYIVYNDSVETSHNRNVEKEQSQRKRNNRSNSGNVSNLSRSSVMNETKKESFRHQVRININNQSHKIIKSFFKL